MAEESKTEIIVLDDEPVFQEEILDQIPEDISSIGVSTSEELERAVEEHPDAEMFFLDNMVPTKKGDKPASHFMENAQVVLNQNPDAKIFYIGGSLPSPTEAEFCSTHGIRQVAKHGVRKVFKEIAEAQEPEGPLSAEKLSQIVDILAEKFPQGHEIASLIIEHYNKYKVINNHAADLVIALLKEKIGFTRTKFDYHEDEIIPVYMERIKQTG